MDIGSHVLLSFGSNKLAFILMESALVREAGQMNRALPHIGKLPSPSVSYLISIPQQMTMLK